MRPRSTRPTATAPSVPVRARVRPSRAPTPRSRTSHHRPYGQLASSEAKPLVCGYDDRAAPPLVITVTLSRTGSLKSPSSVRLVSRPRGVVASADARLSQGREGPGVAAAGLTGDA